MRNLRAIELMAFELAAALRAHAHEHLLRPPPRLPRRGALGQQSGRNVLDNETALRSGEERLAITDPPAQDIVAPAHQIVPFEADRPFFRRLDPSGNAQ